MKTQELADKLGIEPRMIRHYARRHFVQLDGEWDFTDSQVKIIADYFKMSKKLKESQRRAKATV